MAGDTAAGIWVGSYACLQGTTGLTLSITSLPGSRVNALFHFYADTSNPAVPEGCFEMEGTFDPDTRHLDLRAGKWLLRPAGFVTVDLSGEISANGGTLKGRVTGPSCTSFELHPAGVKVARDPAACRPGGETVASIAPN